MKVTNLCITIIWISVFCFLSIHAMAEEYGWKFYYTTPDGTKHFYDSKSIIRTSQGPINTSKRRIKTRKARSKVWLVKVKEKAVFNKPDYKLKESRILREFDCSERKVRMLMKSDFYKDGTQKIEIKTRPWENIGSEPFFEVLYEIVCPS